MSRKGIFHPVLYVLIGAVFIWSSLAFAARMATVDEGGVDVYETPNKTSKVLEKLPPKAEIAVSNLPTEGFHKVRTPSGVMGWVEANSLVLQPPPTDEEVTAAGAPDPKEEEKRIEMEKKEKKLSEKPGYMRQYVRFRALGDINLFTAAGIVSNFDSISQGYSYGGEVAFMLTSHLGLVLRVESLFKSVALTDSNTGKVFQIDLSSSPMMGGADLIIVQGPRASVHIGAYAGMTSKTEVKSTNLTDAAPPATVADVVTTNPTALGKVELNWQFSRLFSGFLEAGYRYLVTSSLAPPSNKGSLILNPAFSVNLSGPVFGAGIGVSF